MLSYLAHPTPEPCSFSTDHVGTTELAWVQEGAHGATLQRRGHWMDLPCVLRDWCPPSVGHHVLCKCQSKPARLLAHHFLSFRHPFLIFDSGLVCFVKLYTFLVIARGLEGGEANDMCSLCLLCTRSAVAETANCPPHQLPAIFDFKVQEFRSFKCK